MKHFLGEGGRGVFRHLSSMIARRWRVKGVKIPT
jgi:hypothetical protein